MIRIMTYNVGPDIKDNLSLLVKIIKTTSPDILLINESNWLAQKSLLLSLSVDLELPYYCFAKSSNTSNDTTLLSKYPLKDIVILKNFKNSGILCVAKTIDGDISLAGVHLSPSMEDIRKSETAEVITKQGKYKLKVIFGDLNSISPENLVSVRSNGKLHFESARYDVIKKIRDSRYFDTAILTNKDQDPTVLNTKDGDTEYVNLRLDYVFISDTLGERLLKYEVVVNNLTRLCSDHYPVLVTLK